MIVPDLRGFFFFFSYYHDEMVSVGTGCGGSFSGSGGSGITVCKFWSLMVFLMLFGDSA